MKRKLAPSKQLLPLTLTNMCELYKALLPQSSSIVQTDSSHLRTSLPEMWIFSCFLLGSLASSLQGVNETVLGIPTMAPPPASTSTSTPLSRLLCVWLSVGSLCLVVLLLLLVLLVRKYVCDKSVWHILACEQEAEDDIILDAMYRDIILSDCQQQPISGFTETDPAAGQSSVRTDDVNYAEIIIRDNGNKSNTRDFRSEPEVIYSTVK